MKKKLEIVKTIPQHFKDIEIQEAQAFCREPFETNPNYAILLCEQGFTRTGIAEDGTIVGIMGLLFNHANSASGWGILSPHFKKYIRQAIPAVKEVLASYSHINRIEVSASVKFPEAHKLLTKSFGFKPEAILEKYDILGHDHILYTRIANSIEWEMK